MPSLHPLSAAALFDLKGWVAVVTGGGTGVGLMMAQTFAANGAKVYITGRRTEVLETSASVHGSTESLNNSGGSIVPLTMDVTDKESIKKAVAEIKAQDGFVSILVNNAGVWKSRPTAGPDAGPEAFGEAMFAENIDDWQESFMANSTSPYFVTAAFVPLLTKAVTSATRQVGCIINNASISGLLRMTQRQQYSYNMSKAAAIHLTRQMAFDLGHEKINIRVNGVALGYFPSEMTTGPSDDKNESSYDVAQFQAFFESMGLKTVKRMGSARDLASAVLTLATNDYMCGTITVVDGGSALNLPGCV
ncbi:NAD(P)-binding protein [Xylariaceae sp. FL0255]|nr:NAD(P)-binding protein [Xylariaceae sp. FL0255]